MLTNVPDRLERAGVAPNDVEPELREIVAKVTDKGPGGHILTGPIYVEGADSGDVLEVRILEITPKIKYGYNGCAGFLRVQLRAGRRLEDHPDRREEDDSGVRAGHRHPAQTVLRQHGRRAGR